MENKPVTESRPAKSLSFNRVESMLGTTGRVPPQAVEFEAAVLGALMIDDNAVNTILDFLSAKMFYMEAHQHIFKAIEELFMLSQPVDLLTVTNQLRKEKLLELVGGASYLASLTNRVTSSANVEYHARVVMEKFVVRELIHNCNEIITDSYDESNDVLDLLDTAESKIFNIVENNFKRDSKLLHQVVRSALDTLESLRQNSDDLQGVPCGIRCIDERTGGWQKSDLIIVGGRPGMGKTSFVLSVARNAALDYNLPVALFSLEMSATQLVHRLFSMESGIPSDRISKGTLNDAEWIRLMDNIGKLESSNLIIDDTPALSVFDLRAKCRRLKHKHHIQLIIVDYLQLMRGGNESMNRTGNREQEISYISRSLKALAKELDVPVIALAQLSRAVEMRASSKRPQLSDLRESGSIEQDADMVLFLYRPEYYHVDTFEDGTPSAGLAEVLFEKNRHGSTGSEKVRFISQYTKFTDLEYDYFKGADTTFSDDQSIRPNKNFEILESSFNDDDANAAAPGNEDPLGDMPF